MRTAALAAAVALPLAHAAPAVTTLPALRQRLLPGLHGLGAPDRVALTFDDGPDPESTPHFLDVLAAHRVRATFFVLGVMLRRRPDLGRRLVAAGHEVALHGWAHDNLLLRGPAGTVRDLTRAYDLVVDVTGRPPAFLRPPYGVLTGAALVAARRLRLRPVLWSCWGRDWTTSATGDGVRRRVLAGLRGGGTVLLHDSSCAAAPGAWRAGLAALPGLLAECRHRGWKVGPLGGHGLAAR
ncbi:MULTISPECIES: polysaccharide deacetylase family protein [unclassified Micromonospora]|uniref:polysaccharide deacetylase family protein n=1 Tax=unclassified Micromonospora TaxID=2617518 RepID=UPI0022C929F3|nr:polysaccharide deacetylase family protein [Micromonospora sp. AKA38]GHJ16911.1 polysaccharide deacetylase familiy protein [Micromonospora sp. AKA38]